MPCFSLLIKWNLTVVMGFLALTAHAEDEWFSFQPGPDHFQDSPIDLRFLSERHAGDGGFIATRGGQFIHSATSQPLRFWGVNGCPGETADQLHYSARILAKYGVNLVRLHGGMFDDAGEVDPKRVQHAIATVSALKEQGIYSHLSIYFPLWLTPKPNTPWLDGYNGQQHPFAALYFNPQFQERYRSWWKALLTTSGPHGKKLVDEPAVFGAEIINEDSYLFWTFNPQAVPDAELKIVEKQFGDWLTRKYGSIDDAARHWPRRRLPRDDFDSGRVAFRGLWEIANQRTKRDQDTVAFLVESQRAFYKQTYDYLRGLGFKGVICASNWATADPRVLGPLEKYSYADCDFVDRHGYFGGALKGTNASWSIQDGYEYSDSDALKFEASEPGKPRSFNNTVMDVHYDGKPSMTSEISFTRPNRYRTEAPLYYACYGALQDSNAILQFAFDGSAFSVKPAFFMQPWTLMSPGQMGQFPAAALIYRKGLIATGETVASFNLKIGDLLKLDGTPLPQDAAFDELRLADVPKGATVNAGQAIDPLCHYVGSTSVTFSADGGPAKLVDLSSFINHEKQTVISRTHELKLDYGHGLMTINADKAQGINGNLHDAGLIELKDLSIQSDLPIGQIVAVSLDDQPLAQSGRILLQVMSEEKPNGWQEQDEGNGMKRIVHIGTDPWMVRSFRGTVKFKRGNAASLQVIALDGIGGRGQKIGAADSIALKSDVMYYLIEK